MGKVLSRIIVDGCFTRMVHAGLEKQDETGYAAWA